MKINKEELQKALEKVKPGLANKEIIEQSTSFAFVEDKVVTYNDEISISHPVKGLNFTGAVKAQELYQYLNKIKQEEIDISWDENQFKITAGKAKAGLIFQKEVSLPIEEIGKISKWKNLPKTFIEALKFCKTSCSTDMSRPILTCIEVNKEGIVKSSDGYRLTSYSLSEEMPIDTFLIPATSANELIKYDITQITKGEGWVHFKTKENTIFSCRVFDDAYPDTKRLFEVEGKAINIPMKMISSLDRASVFAKKEFNNDSKIIVKLEEKQMTLSAQADFGWFEENLRVNYLDEPIEFETHPIFLAEILTQVKSCILGKDRMKFEGENWSHVLSLSMIKQGEE